MEELINCDGVNKAARAKVGLSNINRKSFSQSGWFMICSVGEFKASDGPY